MMATLPMAFYGLEVPAGDVAVLAAADIPAAFRITMAAIDPSAEAEDLAEGAKPRATLKLIRQPLNLEYDDEDEDESDFDEDEMNMLLAEGSESEEDAEEDEEETKTNGGSSEPKSKKARKAAAAAEIKKLLESEEMEVDSKDTKTKDKKSKVNGKANGKGKDLASDVDEEVDEDEEDEEDSDVDSFDSGDEVEEFVICTLDPEKTYQQALDITIGEDEIVYFKVSGTHSVYLTGNYVEPAHDHDHEEDYDSEDDEDEYDLTPDEDELEMLEGMSEDDLDDLEDPRLIEVDTEEEEMEAPTLVSAKKQKAKETGKGKNKRPAEDSDAEETTLDEMITKAKGGEDKKLSKKQAKKLKNAAGEAVPVTTKDEPKTDKRVSFSAELETGPTPSPAATKSKDDKTAGPKVVQGVTIDVKKQGEGDAAKKGDKVGMRYIGKLQKTNAVFDSNKKGKPFTFTLGAGEVIKGWDIGINGLRLGAEARLTIPAHLAYGSKAQPGIPSQSTLIFDVKVMEIKKK